jgi:uncharacterized protein (DUF983 family)
LVVAVDNRDSTRPSLARMLWRGVRKRCPWCGGGKLFTGWFTMKERCPTCGLRFEREEGFFLGAFVINIAVTEAALLVCVVLGVVLTLPDPPVLTLSLVGAAAAVIVPLFTYPFSKTIWSAIDLAMHPIDPWEEAEQIIRHPH